ncbi:phosphotransferase system enzyme I (PtsI) [Chitinivorax tropicus]|uniref:Phosphoenolpyruvate-protein phosphotransferase n=1 Tax=Chitinivorax tropicus TaxID=714531 RepID=A0A840MF86_9PROT|nr:phosphoenolpyruvate--protein phosphotransferase [Chitinivorax tropicus]MBB5017060.1 phosphotransferase system enzyme I (PtsI) [Chitinivorax tropicus]
MGISLHGIGVVGGIAIGHAHLMSHEEIDVAHYEIPTDQIPAEQARFDKAIRATRKELEMLWGSIPENAPAELGSFLSLHIMILNDNTLSREPRVLIEEQRCNAEWALKQQLDMLLAQFDEIEEEYLRERRADVMQVTERIFKALAGQPGSNGLLVPVAKNSILVAHELSPADMVLFKDHQFAAFVTDVGGATSHTAIVARSLDMPAVLALHHAHELIQEGELLIVDGIQGVVIVDPDEKILAEYKKRQTAWVQERKRLKGLKGKVPTTRDGVAVELLSNIELPSDLDQVKANGATGIGLFRSEFLFLGRDEVPCEDEQFEAYRAVVEEMGALPTTIRTLDLGADKVPKWQKENLSINPALGLCGIRLCLAEPQMFRTQLRALLRASQYGNLQLLVPMLISITELSQMLMHLELAKQSLADEGVPFNKNIRVGAMVETPAAVVMISSFLKYVDFISIGTNDLIQYTLAIDRGDDAVAHLYDPVHPAVLHLIHQTIKAADRVGVPVSVCGEMAGDHHLTRLLLGLGLRKFSMHPAHLLDVKQKVLHTDLIEIQQHINRMLKAEDSDKMRDLLDQLNAL